MRKVIPYIASQFRKDKIWLRRTKKSKRQYQIVLAVDDSSSMADNHSKQVNILDIFVLCLLNLSPEYRVRVKYFWWIELPKIRCLEMEMPN